MHSPINTLAVGLIWKALPANYRAMQVVSRTFLKALGNYGISMLGFNNQLSSVKRMEGAVSALPRGFGLSTAHRAAIIGAVVRGICRDAQEVAHTYKYDALNSIDDFIYSPRYICSLSGCSAASYVCHFVVVFAPLTRPS